MSMFLKSFLCILFIVRGGCSQVGQHVGLDVSKNDRIILVTRGASSDKPLGHETFPNCVVVGCDDGNLHVPRDIHVCRSTSVNNHDPKSCGVVRGALMMAGLTEEDDPLEHENDQSQHAKLSLDADGELFYSVEAFPEKKIYLDEVLDVIFSVLPQNIFESMATLMIPHDFLFEQRQAIMDSLLRSAKIQVTESLRFNPCRVSDSKECSASAHLSLEELSLDSTLLDHLNKKHENLPSHAPVGSDIGKQTTDLLADSAPSESITGLARESIGSFSSGPTLVPTAIPADVPTLIPMSIPGPRGPTTTPTRLSTLVNVPSERPSRTSTSHIPSFYPSDALSSVPSLVPCSVPVGIPSFRPSFIPSDMPSFAPFNPTTARASYAHQEDVTSGYENGEAGVLTAGEWVDAKNYLFWKTLVNCTGGAPQCYAWVEKKWNLCTGYPIAVTVTQLDENQPVSDLSVAIFSESHMNMNLKGFGRTNVHGNTTMFLKIDDCHCNYRDDFVNDLRVSIQVERMFMGEFKVKNLKRENGIPSVHFVIDHNIKQENTLDLMFVTDTTGSMSDELSFLKSDLEKMVEIVEQACAGDDTMKIRTSVNFYRDVGDEYVVKAFPFDIDVKRNVKRVSAQFASGGGDFPEAVDRALDDALFNHKWSKKHGAKARLLFLILDAPPHSDRQVIDSLAKSMKRAQKLGVRVIPVTGSGIDKETEMLMRMFGLVTDGSYIHLTDDSGVGLSHVETKTTIPDHPVGKLLNVMVGTIRRYLGCSDDENKLGATDQ